uniref:Centromere-associated protein E n=1 Tax=Sarcophilus harrisii TaxID=9305 RepID=G3VKC3_SARHA
MKIIILNGEFFFREQDLGDATQLYWKTENRLISQIDGTKSFSFDRVFHSNETTEKVYEEIAVPIICSAIQGYNGTIFAYGQTASGKTYTMMGSADGLGVIPKAVNDIFKKIKEIPEREFLLRVSYMEIYNETITDLLCDTRKMKPLEIREDFNRNVYVADLTEEVVSTPELALQWIKKGERNRHYGKTKMNQRSSRSHTIFRMILESREKGDPSNCDGAVMVSHLNLVDLAGSERASQTGAEGVRLKEGCNINRSLFILGQVIKKLSDGQAGGFINYRDSKLTRILQNSLGGNAKTLIICTITPVSFDETLSTLQFASTAKYMKNTPHVNEVLDDEALLKRYRKEIIDLKKQLEEVSSETRVQAMEKDQLAQLLEEKDLLQKVQNDKIQNLTQMLVTSSSITLQQDLKAKRKRRVTWCPGKMNKMKDIGYIDDFDTTKAIVPMSIKPTIPSIVETDESLCSEFDVFSNTLETISESEWNPATKLNQETVQNELNLLRANFDNLVLDYEQLQRKKTEMELKLNEKLELDEFVTLEMQTIKEQEVRNNKILNIMKHGDIYHSLFLKGIENELNLKSQLLKEKEEQIKELQKLLELQRIENMKMDFSSSVENGEKLYEELKHLKQSLCDTETIALDAKKENAFLKSENQELKENMEELLNRCSQLEKENHLYQSQLKERRNISERRQADLERELQSAFNEITKLTSIIDGKYPKDLLLAVELERKVKDLQKDLDKEIEENEALRKEINVLSELKSLPTELEILRKERLERSKEIDLIMAEKDKLLAEVVDKDNILQELVEEAHEVVLDFDDLLSEKTQHKTLEPEKLLEVREELCKAPQKLEKQLNSGISGLRTVEMEKQLLTEELHENLEGRPDTYEKGDLKQPQEILQSERDQFRNDSQDATDMIENPHLNSLDQNFRICKLEAEFLNKIGPVLVLHSVHKIYADKEFKECFICCDLAGQNLDTPRNLLSLTDYEKDNELLQQQRQISSLLQEKNQLQQMLEYVTNEKNQLKTDLEENIEMSIENQEELRNIGAALKKQQEAVFKERKKTAEKEEELLRTQEMLEDTEKKLSEKIQELQEKEEQLLNVRKEVTEAQEKVNKMEELREQLKSRNSTLERIKMENLEMAQKLQASLEETTSITKEISELKKIQMALQLEKDQLEQNIKEVVTKGLETQEDLKIAQLCLKEHQETIDKLKECISDQASQGLNDQGDLKKINVELQEKIQELQAKQEQIVIVREEAQEKINEMEQLKEQLISKDSALKSINLKNQELIQKLQASVEEKASITEERDKLTKTLIALKEESHQLKKLILNLLTVREEITEAQEKLNEVEHLKERIVMENLELAQKLQASLEEVTSVTEERDKLTKTQETLHIERDQLKETIRDLVDKDLETQGKLKIVQMHLKEHQQTIDKLKECISEKTTQVSEMQEALAKTNTELKKREKTEQVFNVKEEVTEAQEKVKEVEHLKEQLKLKDYTLERIEIENMELTQKFQAILEKATSVTEERDGLTKAQEALHIERDQLKETIRDLVAKIQELQENKEQVLNVREEVTETQEKMKEVEHLKEQLKSKDCTLERIVMENLELAQKLQASLEEATSVTEERDELTKTQEVLYIERDQLKETIRDLVDKDLETQKELKLVGFFICDYIHIIITKDFRRAEEKNKRAREAQRALQDITVKINFFFFFQNKIQELQEEKEQVFNVRKEVTEAREKMNEVEHLKEQLKSKNFTLERIEIENLELAQKLQASLEETASVTEERDGLTKTQEALQIERDQLKETIRDLLAEDQKIQEELKFMQMITDKLKEDLSEKEAQIFSIQGDLEKTNNELQQKILKLQETEEVLLSMRKEVNETKLERQLLCQLEEQLKKMNHTLSLVETEKMDLTQKLDASLSKMNTVIKERDALQEADKALQMEINQLKESLKKSRVVDQQKPKEVVNIEANTGENIKQHSIESLKEKYLQINELLKKYTMMENRYGFLSRLSLDLKKTFESQNELQGVLKRVIDIRKEHHNTINKFEKNLIEEAEKQNDLFIKIQHLQLHAERGSQELSSYKKLSQKMDLHIEQILKDVSETQNDIHSMVVEFQQLLNAKKDIILFLEMCLSTHLDVENLKKIIQEDSDRIVHVNNFYHNKIKAMMNESSEFEDRSAAACKEWELELRQMKDKNEEMLKVVQTTHLTLDGLDTLTIGENMKQMNMHVEPKEFMIHSEVFIFMIVEQRKEKETELHLKGRGMGRSKDKENKQKIKAMQKNLEVSKVGSNKQLRSQQPTVQSQDIKAVSSKEIDDLKMQLVKLNMEKLNESKKLEKEIASKTAIIEHMEEIISQLKENLRRAQQCNNTSILEPSGHAQASHAPLTCGGGSGIIQSTKALILKADRVRLEREISKLKKQNEYLTNHQSQLSREVKKWKERALKKEAQELSCVHSPKSPKLAEMTSLKKQYTSPLNKEQISQETLPKDSPKSWAYDGRSKSLPVTCLNNYFDNSGLGLLPETQTPGEENTESLMHQWQSSSGKDAPECKTQ